MDEKPKKLELDLKLTEKDIKDCIKQSSNHLNLCYGDIEVGNQAEAIAYFKMVKMVIDEYPGRAVELRAKYDHVKILYEAKFGKLEEELQ